MQPLFRSRRDRLDRLRRQREEAVESAARRSAVQPSGSQICPGCGSECANQDLVRSEYVCPHCGYHLPIGAYLRLSLLLDPFTFRELWPGLTAPNALEFPGYEDKLATQREKAALSDAAVAAVGKLDGISAVFAVLDSRFFMGSMGVAVGEKITRAAEYAQKHHLPLIIFSASGGARMQEGILSLMQMAKTSAAIRRFSDAGGLYISVFTHPTTGGVTASFASLGDITLAEPGALIGFAGPRVIRQTIGQELPDGFQRAEYLEEHGFVDQIVPRGQMRDALAQLLALHRKGVLHR
ncbi:MAG: acetyl-CoA carboxylase carboxyltransferase subunit beta [Oscillospiraceae bacterium]|jgi:acetyl-CoA carboxylase carboxyl transferase subunit beta|nr:acetyl-CoA carboxylase carboxyltransferase subunit beta [Oscillospiraceae bacterium]